MATEKAWQGMKWVRHSTRLALYARHDFRCVYCERDAARSRTPRRFGLDHLVARELGGTNAAENLAMACKDCNARKGAMDLDAWLDVLAEEGRDVDAIRARLGATLAEIDRPLGRDLAAAWERGASLATIARRARAAIAA